MNIISIKFIFHDKKEILYFRDAIVGNKKECLGGSLLKFKNVNTKNDCSKIKESQVNETATFATYGIAKPFSHIMKLT